MSFAVTAPDRAIVASRPWTRILGIASFAVLTALGAKTALPLPFTPVPITLQTFFVLLAGVVLGARDGAASQTAYLALGFTGLPVFAGPAAGPAYLLGPTGGFLIAFPVAAWIAGAGTRPGDGAWRAAVVLFSALALVLASGTAWLASALEVPAGRALVLGALPFLPGAALKAVAAGAVVARQRPERSR